ncbi:hypothetical protein F5J12DRAFT_781783 [Pisolithus orientalis]|uniref:uncharacterized protein n=1 Tax=Pisolithus orientalis TaxID=936130 RepID=UPI00222460F0|nr:uncharacterized protein F5J12DRAFT_781783 [Pisolithus orientalis]KAI6010800.1 hypothetical protein F5J12DRAFT_781783 [Pisolithus orientalis]
MAGSLSIQEPNLVQGNDANIYYYMDDASPLRTLRIPKSQNSYLEEWLPYKSRYLSVLLDMEALPDVMACFTSFYGLLVWCYTWAMAEHHAWQDAASHVDEEWEDIEESQQPAHLNPPNDRSYLTVVDTGGMHFCNVQYCNCPGSEDSHLQLTMASLFPTTTKALRTTFTFQVLEDFIRDNVESIQRVTLSMFPHLVLGIAQGVKNVRVLKLLKWQGFHQQSPDLWAGELVLFCSACPQPGIKVLDQDIDLSDWQFARTFVMDSNFKVKHMLPKNAAEEVWLMDGNGFMDTSAPYKEYLTGTINQIEKSDCNNHWAVNQANAQRNKLESTIRDKSIAMHFLERIGCISACVALFGLNHSALESLESPLPNGIALALKQKFKVAKQSLAAIQDKFGKLDSKVPDGLHHLWVEQELVGKSCQWNTPQAMDIYEVWLEKGKGANCIICPVTYIHHGSTHHESH